ncbi:MULTISPECIES: hypothetical protein [Burkholderia]|uniref:hypothetical protein n=1 Tax=Burkholderia TaxID=32008 RepID=UPI0015C60DD1|nr:MULTISPECIES: hypothetical protein [Burkholderia]
MLLNIHKLPSAAAIAPIVAHWITGTPGPANESCDSTENIKAIKMTAEMAPS